MYERLFAKVKRMLGFYNKDDYILEIFYCPTTVVVWFRSVRSPLSRPELTVYIKLNQCYFIIFDTVLLSGLDNSLLTDRNQTSTVVGQYMHKGKM